MSTKQVPRLRFVATVSRQLRFAPTVFGQVLGLRTSLIQRGPCFWPYALQVKGHLVVAGLEHSPYTYSIQIILWR